MVKKPCPTGLIRAITAWCPDIKNIHLCIFAGGFIRAYYAGEKPADLDVYFKDSLDARLIQDELTSADWEIVFETGRAVTLKKDNKLVQIIKFYFPNAETLIQNFDFTICCAAVHVSEGEEGLVGVVYLHDDFFEHLAGRILVFQGSPLPLASLKRAIKYIQRGYHICDENIIALAKAIAGAVDFENEESVKEHIAGMDPQEQEEGLRIRVID